MMLLGIVIVLLGVFTYTNLFVAADMVEKERKDKVAWKHYWESVCSREIKDSCFIG